MNDKLRLKITDVCQRNCEGCCNKDFPNVKKFDFGTAFKYKEVYLTGGEPMLVVRSLKSLLAFFRELNVKSYIYTSMCRMQDLSNWSSLICDYSITGITFTVHEAANINEFKRMDRLLAIEKPFLNNLLSLRLNKFDHFEMDYKPLCDWQIKEIHWLKNCPLPEGEDFRKL